MDDRESDLLKQFETLLDSWDLRSATTQIPITYKTELRQTIINIQCAEYHRRKKDEANKEEKKI